MKSIRTNGCRWIGWMLVVGLAMMRPLRAQSEFNKQTFTTAEGNVLPYRILYPKSYDRAKKYPLVVVLHGAGERGDDNEKQLALGSSLFLDEKNRRNFPAIVLFPQCPTTSFWASVQIDRRTTPYTIGFDYKAHVNWPMQAVVELVQQMKLEGLVDKNRLCLLGISMGGLGVFETLATQPDLFTTAVSICGGGKPEDAPVYARKVRLWLFHGGSDSVVNVEYSRRMVARLKELKADVRYTEYHGVDHESWEPALAEPELLEWLFKRK
ncbi:prolyl oligopeptidase family serine peptidase [Larkinella sp. VNQ87]|uniref:carboxylesterase family protein n=1 Tax=Larkinella sp. VNQ87 TaxID=3400921 RepID=UPI003C116B09